MEFGQSIRAECSRVTTVLNGFSHLAGCEGRGLVIERVPGSEFFDGLPGVWVFFCEELAAYFLAISFLFERLLVPKAIC